jgi:murein DD-endopeptidase MepM/ murein hydrolase activator NlpD
VRHADPLQRGRRLTWWLVVLALVVTLVPASTAAGDDDGLKRRKHQVERRVEHAHDELATSTRRLIRAKKALDQVRERLDTARDAYHLAHGKVVAAALVDDRAQAELDAAQVSLARAEARVGQSLDRILQEETLLRSYAVDAFQSGDPTLLSLSMVLTTDEPADLMGRLSSMDTVADRQAGALSRLEAAKVVHEVERARLEETRDLVAERRERAADTLHARQAVEQAAGQARAQVRALADEKRAQKAVAAAARDKDRKHLRKLRKERAHVQRLLQKYYAEQRRKARASAHRAPAKGTGMPWPANGWVSSSFGMRLHPVYHRWALHDGLDVAAPCGRPVHATARGVVVARYYSFAYGNRVVIAHGLRRGIGLATTYNHLSRFSTFRGQKVRQGDVIGYVGSTGFSTGCHLHYMVMRNGRPVNPRPWLR